MEFPSEEELKKWAKEHGYEDYAENIELIKILYAKDELKTKIKKGEKLPIKIIDIPKKVGETVTVRGIVAQIEEYSYMGCPRCGRKNCDVHMMKPEMITIQNFLVGDDTGMVWCTVRAGRFDFKEKDEVIVTGKTKMFKGDVELNVNRLEVVKSG